MKLPRIPGLVWLALALAASIAWLGILQWRWVRQASEAEQTRMKSLLDARVSQFAQEFDRRITNLYARFVYLPSEDRPQPLSARAAELFAEDEARVLVREVFAVHGRPGEPLRIERFDATSGAFVPVDWPVPLAGLRQQLVRGQPAADARPFVWRVGQRVDITIPALVAARPMLRLDRPAGGAGADPDRDVLVTVVTLDRDALLEAAGELLARHFPEEPGFSYRVLLREEQGRPLVTAPVGLNTSLFDKPDAQAHLLRIRNEFFDRVQMERARAVGGSPSGSPEPARRGPPGDGREPPDRRDGRPSRMPWFLAPGFATGQTVVVVPDLGQPSPRWEVVAVHTEGSLARAVARSRRWNLGLSVGVLALLAASVALALVASQRAQRLARERVEFVAGVSHELRTPLAVIRSAAENLADGVVADEGSVRRYGSLIADEGRKLSAMVDQVLTFSGLESSATLRLGPVEAHGILDDALASVSPLLAEAEIEVERHEDADLPPLLADHDALTRAVANLVANAVKHAGSSRWVGLRASVGAQGQMVQLSVEDRGPGIPPGDLMRVFEPFYRGAAAVAGQVHGSGLGLSLVKRIAEQHGGRVEVASRAGQGTTFTLVIRATARPTALATGVVTGGRAG
jgi:signal transduction histidine kinase